MQKDSSRADAGGNEPARSSYLPLANKPSTTSAAAQRPAGTEKDAKPGNVTPTTPSKTPGAVTPAPPPIAAKTPEKAKPPATTPVKAAVPPVTPTTPQKVAGQEKAITTPPPVKKPTDLAKQPLTTPPVTSSPTNKILERVKQQAATPPPETAVTLAVKPTTTPPPATTSPVAIKTPEVTPKKTDSSWRPKILSFGGEAKTSGPAPAAAPATLAKTPEVAKQPATATAQPPLQKIPVTVPPAAATTPPPTRSLMQQVSPSPSVAPGTGATPARSLIQQVTPSPSAGPAPTAAAGAPATPTRSLMQQVTASPSAAPTPTATPAAATTPPAKVEPARSRSLIQQLIGSPAPAAPAATSTPPPNTDAPRSLIGQLFPTSAGQKATPASTTPPAKNEAPRSLIGQLFSRSAAPKTPEAPKTPTNADAARTTGMQPATPATAQNSPVPAQVPATTMAPPPNAATSMIRPPQVAATAGAPAPGTEQMPVFQGIPIISVAVGAESADTTSDLHRSFTSIRDSDIDAKTMPIVSVDKMKTPAEKAKAQARKGLSKLKLIGVKKKDSTPFNVLTLDDAEKAIPSEETPVNRMLMKLLQIARNKAQLTVTVSEDEIIELCYLTIGVLRNQPPFIEIDAPVVICGDIHGQFSDLLRIFHVNGFPPDTNYLFLGDYVDRGSKNLETICLLLCYKVLYPLNFFILRGNHECYNINMIYGFFEECCRRYASQRLWQIFQDTFNWLPLVACVGGRILCMHGGLSPQLTHFDQLRNIQRPVCPEPPSLEIDLLWADPNASVLGWVPNPRAVSYLFGADIVQAYLKHFDLDLVVRAHQVVQDGYEFFADRRLITVFSAPHYCGQFDNNAATIHVSETLQCSFTVFTPLNRSTRLALERQVALQVQVKGDEKWPQREARPLGPVDGTTAKN